MSSSKRQKLDTRQIRCYSCRSRVLDYPFVHQYCQHVVCGVCSFQQKKELYCLACKSQAIEYNSPLALLATKNGHCQQIFDIGQPIYGDIMNAARQDLVVTAPGAYAQATVQSSTLVSAVGVQPIISQVPKGPRSWASFCFCCCIWERIGAIISYVIYFIAFLAAFAWVIWGLNWAFTGNSDLRNLPFFRNLPYADAPLNSATTPAMPINFAGFDMPLKAPPSPHNKPKYDIHPGPISTTTEPPKRKEL